MPFLVAFLLTLLVFALPEPVLAYGGPGSVISGIGAFLALIVAVLASLFGFIWFPLKRIYRKMKDSENESKEPAA